MARGIHARAEAANQLSHYRSSLPLRGEGPQRFQRTGKQTNRTLFTLTMVTVLALPINLIAGLFGMNVGGIPLAEYSHRFSLIVAAHAALTALLAFLTLGQRRD